MSLNLRARKLRSSHCGIVHFDIVCSHPIHRWFSVREVGEGEWRKMKVVLFSLKESESCFCVCKTIVAPHASLYVIFPLLIQYCINQNTWPVEGIKTLGCHTYTGLCCCRDSGNLLRLLMIQSPLKSMWEVLLTSMSFGSCSVWNAGMQVCSVQEWDCSNGRLHLCRKRTAIKINKNSSFCSKEKDAWRLALNYKPCSLWQVSLIAGHWKIRSHLSRRSLAQAESLWI